MSERRTIHFILPNKEIILSKISVNIKFERIKRILSTKTGIKKESILLYYKEKLLNENSTLQSSEIKSEERILLKVSTNSTFLNKPKQNKKTNFGNRGKESQKHKEKEKKKDEEKENEKKKKEEIEFDKQDGNTDLEKEEEKENENNDLIEKQKLLEWKQQGYNLYFETKLNPEKYSGFFLKKPNLAILLFEDRVKEFVANYVNYQRKKHGANKTLKLETKDKNQGNGKTKGMKIGKGNGNGKGKGNKIDLQNFLDPQTIEKQKQIEEKIRLFNIERNKEKCKKEHPDIFNVIKMLYIKVWINGIPFLAFVDTGAQTTIMTSKIAQKAGLMRLLDQSYSGVAFGVGQTQILGKIYLVKLQIGSLELYGSVTVLDHSGIDFILGLDFLKRYNAILDLCSNCLRVGNQNIKFLSQKEIELFSTCQKNQKTKAKNKTKTKKQTVKRKFEKKKKQTRGKENEELKNKNKIYKEKNEKITIRQNNQKINRNRNYSFSTKRIEKNQKQGSKVNTKPVKKQFQQSRSRSSSFDQPNKTPLKKNKKDDSSMSWEMKIQGLLQCGFERDFVIKSLKKTGGDIEMAANLILQIKEKKTFKQK
ncbi:aspartyl protease ddi-related [Anaeramoeba flamelloides]|uniref:Aspartyl protease ddi-related n=1 Tax=Anaeramoeba flamelloides TaxID=1746091 RepID=A0AAV7ZKT6_9EUKA|nr:aspartyl protease ddi-related [Anaeramoeba flamelloides]